MKPNLKLSDGAAWPNPDDGDLEWCLCYGKEFGSPPTQSELLRAASYISAYKHILTHPQGTEATIRQLREARRLVREQAKERHERDRAAEDAQMAEALEQDFGGREP